MAVDYFPPNAPFQPSSLPVNTPGYSPHAAYDAAAVEARLRAEAAKRGLTFDPSDARDVSQNYYNSGGTTTSGDLEAAIKLVTDKYDLWAKPTWSNGGTGGDMDTNGDGQLDSGWSPEEVARATGQPGDWAPGSTAPKATKAPPTTGSWFDPKNPTATAAPEDEWEPINGGYNPQAQARRNKKTGEIQRGTVDANGNIVWGSPSPMAGAPVIEGQWPWESRSDTKPGQPGAGTGSETPYVDDTQADGIGDTAMPTTIAPDQLAAFQAWQQSQQTQQDPANVYQQRLNAYRAALQPTQDFWRR